MVYIPDADRALRLGLTDHEVLLAMLDRVGIPHGTDVEGRLVEVQNCNASMCIGFRFNADGSLADIDAIPI